MTTSSVAIEASVISWRARGPAGWLTLAAAPTFAVMAWIVANDAHPAALCASGSSLLDGMTPMYVLMSLFHVSPWLKLASGRPSARITDEHATLTDNQ